MEADLAQTARAHVETFDAPESSTVGARPIDLVHLARQTFGERDLEGELLRLFDRQSQQILARLADPGMAEGRWRADLAHTLKGSAKAIGAFDVAAAAAAYEDAARAQGDLAPALSRLSTSIAIAHGAIGELLAA
jgi:HPt (histidine-containing phosphotransfer) domain-containing protein